MFVKPRFKFSSSGPFELYFEPFAIIRSSMFPDFRSKWQIFDHGTYFDKPCLN